MMNYFAFRQKMGLAKRKYYATIESEVFAIADCFFRSGLVCKKANRKHKKFCTFSKMVENLQKVSRPFKLLKKNP